MSIQDTIGEFDKYIQNHGNVYANWYVGVAADPKDRLLNDHNVREHGDAWIYRDCGSDNVARSVESYFHRKGCQGGPGGGDERSRYVYAYRIAPHTDEDA